jgi:glycerol-3-phosphate dehydrogenase (NAD(P)+)
MQREALHAQTRDRGVRPVVYWTIRGILQPVFLLYLRMSRIGRAHIPDGPVILASNHRSFLDPFVIGMSLPRPVYYVAKKEMFLNRPAAWLLSSVGAFPVDRGSGDHDAIDTAKAILARGDAVLIFPEGTRTRPGPLGRPRRGVGRLALETGAPVVPVAVSGTEDVRRGWRVRPRKVRARFGPALTFPRVGAASSRLARVVTDRIWACVALQWEWLGGTPPLRRAAVIGAGTWGTAVAALLARAGLEVALGCRTAEQAQRLAAARVNERYLPGVRLPEEVHVARAADLDLSDRDLVCFAVAARDLPAAVAAHAERIPERAGVAVCSKGLVPPLGTVPSAFVAERVAARSVAVLTGPAQAADALAARAAVVVASPDRPFARQLTDVLVGAGLAAEVTPDVTGAELAGCARNAAVLAAGAAAAAGPDAAGAAAGRVWAEVHDYARARGGWPETFAGLAGTGDLVATVVDEGSCDRRAGELLRRGIPAAEIGQALGQAPEAVDTVPLLAAALRDARVRAPALDGLAALVEGRIDPAHWTATLTAARASRPRAA